MLVRQVVIPANADQLWDALTEADEVSAWFGSRVEWDLRPGGRARFFGHDGTTRSGVIDAVFPGRHLRFRWWPEDDGARATSEVTYDLEPDEDGTRLTVTEQPVPPPADPGAVSACGAAAPVTEASWTAWDSRLLGCWAGATAPAPAGRAVHRTVHRCVLLAVR